MHQHSVTKPITCRLNKLIDAKFYLRGCHKPVKFTNDNLSLKGMWLCKHFLTSGHKKEETGAYL